METTEQIHHYLDERYSITQKGIRLSDDTLLLEQKVIDSIGMLELMLFIEETFGFEVPEKDITPDHFGTISNLASYVNNRLNNPVA